MFTPSPQQAEFYRWVEQGQGSAALVAVAGSGKTTTLIQGLRRMAGTVTFCAFNKRIVQDIEAKVREVEGVGQLPNRYRVKTMHGLGFGCLARLWPEAKIDERARKATLLAETWGDRTDEDVLAGPAWQLFDLARQRGFGCLVHASDHKAWLDVWDHFNLALEAPKGTDPAEVVTRAQELLARAVKKSRVIDFTDMIWLPLVLKARPWQTDWVLIDEAQDTNPCRRALAAMMLKPGGRLVAVGDPRQAIYGFTGADSQAVELIKRDFNAIELPLTVTYRCPKAVVREAQRWVSHITAHESAPEGVVRTLAGWQESGGLDHLDEVMVGDAILCRNTKPLVQLAYRLIRKDRPAHVEGRDIGRGLLALTARWKSASLTALMAQLRKWAAEERNRLLAQGKGLMAQSLADRVQTLAVLAAGCATIREVQDRINSIFKDTENGDAGKRITLSTIHKAKGREWDRVWWYGRDRLQPSSYARQAWEQEQEENLMYVAATRAKAELVIVDADEDDGRDVEDDG